MKQHLFTALALSGLIIYSFSAAADGIADQRGEQQHTPILVDMNASQAQLGDHKASVELKNIKPKYIGGHFVSKHPDLTAQQRKYLVFGND